MRTYLRAQSLWEVVENGSNPAPLPDNPTMAQVRFHSDEVAKEGRALAIIQAAIHDDVFIKILNHDTAKEAWDKLKEEFQGSERTRRMKVLNLRREFEAIKMKEAETVKEFAHRLSKVVTQIRLLGEELSDQRVVEKILVCLPERFESKISSLEENKDFSHITISELVNALQATKHRRSLRMEENVEGVFVVNTKGKFQGSSSCGKKPDNKPKLLRMKNSGTKYISDVLYVPEINQNLLSVGQMLEKSYTLHFEDMKCTIFDPSGCELMSIKMRDKSFPIEWKQPAMPAFPSSVDDFVLWHKRLGHFSYSTLKQISSNGLIQNLPSVEDDVDVCDVCQFGKQCRLPFLAVTSWRAMEKLQLIHIDVCGPMSIASLNGSKYFLLFIDDFTRMSWVFFLKQKLDVFAAFQKFKILVENEAGCQIKKLISDNETEYRAGKFKKFYDQVGIQHQFTIPYTPRKIVRKDIKFDEFSKWNWKKHQPEGSSKGLFDEDTLQEQDFEDDEENYDSDTEFPVRGTRTLEDIYARCNVAILEPTRYEETAEFERWRASMKEEIKMIEKNKT
uniref:Retrovirus-related Pol polyprotein from transposon TNT 1-94 n=1 Tax=Cajanus cajan TaxID=3821 RepID=A0A151QYT1_CAJCA|nr:Retrovirus-related Pol polyprotein from transposon TNT 1-94 [Cajanus cajan]